ncbi:hypothetical protein QJS10_CPA09g00333 [Acorus calamus]|uniref:HMG-Y-related protein A n=1 Tax=Acorus calamus TaxID=4465 RepID=A0AAV9E8F5_ACOCL|nr:hypothetical protein QJS10_CPA09g00333 [Acorus calamus]
MDDFNKSTSLPQYSDMIYEAIEALNEKNGSNKSSISRFIESNYAGLPPGHSSLLSHHLTRMRESGELIFLKNNYFRPGPDAPPKRGRGRPPKPKGPLPPGASSPTRSRGRPPKSKDPLELAMAEASGSPPKKVQRTAAPPVIGPDGVVKRGRGRPPKVKPDFVSLGFN